MAEQTGPSGSVGRVAIAILLVLGVVVAGLWRGGLVPLDVAALRGLVGAGAVPPDARRPPDAPVPVTVAAARTEDVPIVLASIGTVQAYNSVAVKSRVDGEIVQVLFHEGQKVEVGDALAQIDPRPLAAQLAQTRAMRAKDQASLGSAQLDQQRTATLLQGKFASQQQLDQQRATVEQLKAQILGDEAQIAYAETQLEYTTIRSPLKGQVGIRLLDQGNIVHASDNTPLVVITQLQPISVLFSIPASAVAVSHLIPGETSTPVIALAADDRSQLDQGTVELVDNVVDPATGTIKLKARFPNAELRLWPGSFVNGRIIVDVRRGAVTIPTAALRHGPGGDFVWTVQANGTALSRGVTAGQASDGRVIIERGLAAGASVVTEGHYRLEDNARVDVTRPKAAPAAARPG